MAGATARGIPRTRALSSVTPEATTTGDTLSQWSPEGCKAPLRGPARLAAQALRSSRMRVWKQGARGVADFRTVLIGGPVQTGPADEDIRVLGLERAIAPDEGRDFLVELGGGRSQRNIHDFDSVHTFAVVRQVLTMYRRAMATLMSPEESREIVDWHWNKNDQGKGIGRRQPLDVYPRFGKGVNAYYSREHRRLEFGYFDPELVLRRDPGLRERLLRVGKQDSFVYLCRSFDAVAHETGHAILDGLRRADPEETRLETDALHEAFADLTTVFAAVSQLDACQAVMAESKTNLFTANSLSIFAQRLGHLLYGRTTGLRNLEETVTLEQAGSNHYRLALVFSGAVYRFMARLFAGLLDPDRFDPAETLLRVGRYASQLVAMAFLRADRLSFEEVTRAMRSRHESMVADLSSRGRLPGSAEMWLTAFAEAFEEVEVDVDARPLNLASTSRREPSFRCGTLQCAPQWCALGASGWQGDDLDLPA